MNSSKEKSISRETVCKRLYGTLQKEKILVAAHRGTPGANIVENTIDAYENALLHGADIIEGDVACTIDGVCYMFHDGNEKRLLGVEQNIKTMTSCEVDGLHYVNNNGCKIARNVDRLDQVLKCFKGRCLINLDRCWDHWDKVFELISKYDMFDQILIKSPVKPKYLEYLESYPVPVMYFPIVYKPEEVHIVREYDVNLVGLELIFDNEDSPLLDEAFLNSYQSEGLFLWVNAITISDHHIFSAKRDDNRAILKDVDEGWGWLLDKGFNVIQTDWPMLLKKYIYEKECNL